MIHVQYCTGLNLFKRIKTLVYWLQSQKQQNIQINFAQQNFKEKNNITEFGK